MGSRAGLLALPAYQLVCLPAKSVGRPVDFASRRVRWFVGFAGRSTSLPAPRISRWAGALLALQVSLLVSTSAFAVALACWLARIAGGPAPPEGRAAGWAASRFCRWVHELVCWPCQLISSFACRQNRWAGLLILRAGGFVGLSALLADQRACLLPESAGGREPC